MMERDFLGLNWKAPKDTTKEKNYREIVADSAWQEAPGWPFSKNFNPPCDQLSLISSGYAFDSNLKAPPHFCAHQQPSLSPTQTSSVDFFIQDLRCVGNVHSSSGGPSQLTIFYDNSVYVYHDVSPQKAEAVMRMAKNDDELDAMVVNTKEASKPVGIHNHINPLIGTPISTPATVPQARKASLDRFLEKRKDRYVPCNSSC